ncbi:hypothetical protein BKI52_06525 [marine bacterium AO1-C]|nr:hypothetical protein BKI52_06525 [marine bacterium AO1-C]
MAVLEGVMAAAELATEVGGMVKSFIPDSPKDLKDKHRWMTVTIINETQYNIVFEESYFDSGRFWTPPTNTPAFKSMTFSGCNKDGSILTGVSGGALFQLQMPKEGGGYEKLNFGVGFSNPEAGSIKISGIYPTKSGEEGAKQAYDKVDDGTTNKKSEVFPGKDKDGHDIKVQFILVASAGQEARVTITEQHV